MNSRYWIHLLWCLCFVLLPGCETSDLRPDYQRARDLIVATTGQSEVYDATRGPLTESEVGAFLAGGLSLDESLQLALLNSRRLQAGFMGLGIARADYVQSGLLENPDLGMSMLLPAGGGPTRLMLDLSRSIADIWELPGREREAELRMELQLIELARQAGELVFDTKAAYYESVAARAARRAALGAIDLEVQSLALLRERITAGVAMEADANLAERIVLDSELASRRAERREADSMRRLASLLSMASDLRAVALTDPLPAPAVAPRYADREQLVESSRAARLDLRALRLAVEAAGERLELEHLRSVPELTVGLGYERGEAGASNNHVLGPSVELELPIFDQNEAQVSKAAYEFQQLRRIYEALFAEVGQQVRAALDGAVLEAQASVLVSDQILPHAIRSAALAKKAFELGIATLPGLLEAERAVTRAQATGLDAALLAALAFVELERAMGGPMRPVDTDRWR
jgi:cobalt-zinc-cadmium efflux system outer membrane protein